MRYKNSESYYNRISNIYHAVVALPLLLFALLYLNHEKGNITILINGDLANFIVLPVVSIISILLVRKAFADYKKYKEQGSGASSLHEKMEIIMQGIIRYSLILGGTSLCLLVGFFATGGKLYMIGYVAVLMIQSFNRPTLQKISDDLMLKGDERDLVLNKKDIPDHQ